MTEDLRVKKLVQRIKELEKETGRIRAATVSQSAAELWMEKVFGALDEVVLVITVDRKILKINPAATRVYGYTENELKHQSTRILHVDEAHYLEFGRLINQSFSQNKPARFEFKAKRKTGDIFPTRHTVSRLTGSSGKAIGIVSIVQDITEQQKADEKLNQSQKKYQSLSKMLRGMCDNVPDMIWAKDLEKKYIFANKAICKKLLNAKDTMEPLGKTDLFFAERERNRHPENNTWHTFGELCQDSDAVTLEKGIPQQFDEFGNIKGQFLFLDVYKAPFIDETGNTIGVVGCARDVTESKKNEKKLKKWNEELEIRIKKRTASLEELNIALKVLLKKREEDKEKIAENIYANYTSLIQPLMQQLRNNLTIRVQEDILDILESGIRDIALPFSRKMSDPMVGLTPTEIQVADLVKEGKTNKEIAQFLNKSVRAVSSHRNNIRGKLGLKHKKTNLRTFLLSLD